MSTALASAALSASKATQLPKIIVLEGNIAAGKTTLARSLAEALDYEYFIEPTTENPYLKRYYESPREYGETMQMWFLHQRYDTYVKALELFLRTGRGVILDRCIFSDYVFAKQNFLDGNISSEGFQRYLTLRKQMLSLLPLPHVLVFLNVPPEVCHHRIIHVRGRECEKSISQEYLAGLHRCYHEMIEEMRATQSVQVLYLDWANFGEPRAIAKKVDGCASWAAVDASQLDMLKAAFPFHDPETAPIEHASEILQPQDEIAAVAEP